MVFKDISLKEKYLIIEKGQTFNNIINNEIKNNEIDKFIFKLFTKLILLKKSQIHYGKFVILDNYSYIKLVKTITSPSNHYEKITIVEGSSKKELNNIFKDHFRKFETFPYEDIVADTYLFSYGSSFTDFKKKIIQKTNELADGHKKSILSEKFTFEEILIIGSLLEKEGIDYEDKKKIFSVIVNRLNKNMKLQIDATVIYALTKNNYKLKRKLNYKDLKTIDRFNTYLNFGLPPEPISYVGLKTIELIYENYSSNYLFYFYNKIKKKHIYSINYKNHLNKLNEYRSK